MLLWNSENVCPIIAHYVQTRPVSCANQHAAKCGDQQSENSCLYRIFAHVLTANSHESHLLSASANAGYVALPRRQTRASRKPQNVCLSMAVNSSNVGYSHACVEWLRNSFVSFRSACEVFC